MGVIWREEKICQNTCFLGTPKQISLPKVLIFRAFYTISLSCIMRRRNNAQILLSNFMNNSQKVSKIKAFSVQLNVRNMEGRNRRVALVNSHAIANACNK